MDKQLSIIVAVGDRQDLRVLMRSDEVIVGICETVNCGPTGICIERSFFENFFYACGCKNGSYNYLNPGPCPGE